MNLFNGKVRLFCVSNILVSFMCTSIMGINYAENPEILEQENSEVSISSNDTEPASRLGEQEKELTSVIQKAVGNVAKKTSTSTKASTTKKTTTSKSKKTTVTKVVTKKEVANKVTYTPAKYSSVTGNAVVDYAKKYLGLRYVSGGNSLTTGTDCSGFTKLIYKEFGVTLSRAAKGQAGNGTYVRKSDLQKGDLVFYGTGKGVISHVAIYIGNGQVIHESNRRDGVKISSVNMMQYITARRVINSKAIKIVEDKIAVDNKVTTTTTAINNDTNTGNQTNTIVESNVQEKVDTTNTVNESTNNTSTTTSEVKETVKEEVKETVPTTNKVEEKVEVKEEPKVEAPKQEVVNTSNEENQQ